MSRVFKFLKQVKADAKAMTWLGPKEVTKQTLMAVVGIGIFAIMCSGVTLGMNTVMELFLK